MRISQFIWFALCAAEMCFAGAGLICMAALELVPMVLCFVGAAAADLVREWLE